MGFFISIKIISLKRLTSKIHSPYICEKKGMTPTIAKNQMLIMNRRRTFVPICKHDYQIVQFSGLPTMVSAMDRPRTKVFCTKCGHVLIDTMKLIR